MCLGCHQLPGFEKTHKLSQDIQPNEAKQQFLDLLNIRMLEVYYKVISVQVLV